MMYLLIPGTLFFLGLTIKIFYWAVNSGQFDDLDTEGHRILFDDDDVAHTKTAAKTTVAEPPANHDRDHNLSHNNHDNSHTPGTVVKSPRS